MCSGQNVLSGPKPRQRAEQPVVRKGCGQVELSSGDRFLTAVEEPQNPRVTLEPHSLPEIFHYDQVSFSPGVQGGVQHAQINTCNTSY